MRFFVRVLAIAALYFLSYSAQANHVLGGNLTWDCLGGNQYTIVSALARHFLLRIYL